MLKNDRKLKEGVSELRYHDYMLQNIDFTIDIVNYINNKLIIENMQTKLKVFFHPI